MENDTKNLETLSLGLASLLDTIGDVEGLPGAAIDLGLSVVRASFGSVQHYPQQNNPQVLYPHTYQNPKGYSEGLYVLDPLFQHFKGNRLGTASLIEVSPAGFTETDYYSQIYTQQGFVDELDHVVQLEGDAFMSFSFYRSAKYGAFNEDERELHRALYPLMAAVGRRLGALLDEADYTEGKLTRKELELALDHFGSEQDLTPRESEVIQLVLRGHNNQSVANQLEIAPDTVKLHRKHAYAKLRVASQGELFFRFLETIGFRESED